MRRISQQWTYSAIWCLGAFVRLLLSQFDRPLIKEFLVWKTSKSCQNQIRINTTTAEVHLNIYRKFEARFSSVPRHTFSLVMSRSPTEYLSHLIYVLTVYNALWNCLSISVSSSKTLLADHSNTCRMKRGSSSVHELFSLQLNEYLWQNKG